MWCIKSENKGQASPPTPLQRERGVVCFVAYGCVIVCVLGLFSIKTLREFGIRKIRYANYRYAVVGDIAIRFLSNLSQNVQYLIPNSRRTLIG